jgi:PII-like signaling protein
MEMTAYSVLKVYASSTDRLGSRLLHEAVVFRAREAGISGATVYRGMMGYGLSSHIHTSKFWELTEKLPVVVELIDTEEKIRTFFSLIEPDLASVPKGCLVTISPVEVVLHKHGEKPGMAGNL